jgi:hypothetical protein
LSVMSKVAYNLMLLILFLNTVVKNAFYSGLLQPRPEKGIGCHIIRHVFTAAACDS